MRRRLNLRLLIWSVVVVAVVAGIVHAVHLVQVDRNARTLLEYARAEMAAKRTDVALERYADYLKQRKDDRDAIEEYALALDMAARNVADRWQVVEVLEPLLVRSGNRSKAREILADNLAAVGRFDAAATHLEVLIAELPERDPAAQKKRAEYEDHRGWFLDALGKHDAAARAYRRSIAADPSRINAYVLLAEILDYRLSRDKDGLDVLDQAVDKNPTSAAARLARFHHQRVFGSEEEAQADLDAAIQLDGKDADVLLAASRWAQAHGDFEKARAVIAEGIQRDDADERLLKESAELELRAGHADKALELATRGLKKGDTKTIELQVFRADLLIDAGKLDEAQDETRVLRARDATSPLPDFLQARLLVARKNFRQAEELLQKIRPRLEKDSYWNSRVNSLLGLVYGELGDLERRIQALTRAMRTDPSWPPLTISLAQAYLESGQPAKALELVEGLSVPEAKLLAARAELLMTLAEPSGQRNWMKVDDAFRIATQSAVEQGEAASIDRLLLRVDITRARGRAAEAEQILKAEMQRQLPTPKAESLVLWLALADLVAARRDADGALAVLTDARKHFGDSAAIRIRTIRILAGRRTESDLDLMRHVADELADFAPEERGKVLRELAEAWIRIGDPDAADALLRRASAEQPRDLRSRGIRFELALQRRQFDEAARVLDEMRNLESPDGALVPFAEAMLRAQNAEAGSVEGQLKEIEKGPLRRNPARKALVKAVLHERAGNRRALIDDLQVAVDNGFRTAPLTARLVEALVDENRLGEASAALTALERSGPLPVDLRRAAVDIAVALPDVDRLRELLGGKNPLDTRDYRDLVQLSRAYAAIDDPVTALRCLNRAIELAPHAPEPWTAALAYLIRGNKRSEALALAGLVNAKTPARYRSFVSGRVAETLGDWKAAEIAYKKALEERPKDAQLRLAVADFYAASERPKEAAELYRTALADAAAPEIAARVRRALAALLARTDRAEARKVLEPNLKNGDSADRRLAWYLDGLDSAGRAAAIRQLEASGKMTAAERFRLVELDDLAGDATSGARNRERILGDQAETPAMLAHFIRELLKQGRTDAADPLLDRLRQMEPTTPRTEALVKLRSSVG